DFKQVYLRETVSGILSVKLDSFNSKGDDNHKHESQLLAEKITKLPYYKKLFTCYCKLSVGSRNDINHAGMRENSRKAGQLKSSLEKYYNLTVKILDLKLNG